MGWRPEFLAFTRHLLMARHCKCKCERHAVTAPRFSVGVQGTLLPTFSIPELNPNKNEKQIGITLGDMDRVRLGGPSKSASAFSLLFYCGLDWTLQNIMHYHINLRWTTVKQSSVISPFDGDSPWILRLNNGHNSSLPTHPTVLRPFYNEQKRNKP